MNKKLPAWLVLTLIALVAALALGATYNGTKDTIAKQEAEKAVAVRQELLPAATDFVLCETEEGAAEVWRGLNADGSAAGYVSTGTVTGFGGPVEVTVGTDAEGVITGVRVGGANFQETAGLGAKSKEPAFYEQFTGKAYPVDLTKNGGEIDAITAATITSSAVVRGVNDTLKTMSAAAGFKINEPVTLVDELGDNRYATSKKGFGGDVYVELTMDNGTISGIVIGDDRFNETAGYGARAKEESFWGQYIGKSGTNLVLGQDIDALSGATITSTAVNDAVNMILLYVNDPAAFAAQMASQPEEIDVSIPEGAVTATAEGKGLTGKFDVTIGVDENGAVNGIEIGATDSDSDAAFLGQVSGNNAFLAQFIGTTGNVSADEIDLVTGATISSRGVVDAANKAYKQAMGIEDEPVPTEAPAQETGNTVKADGLTGKFPVTVELNDDGTVASVVLGKTESDMDESFLAKLDDAFLSQFVGKALPVSGIDTVSGATVSSKAVIAAVNSFAPAVEEPADNTTVKADGLTGKFDVTVELNDDGTVASVKIGKTDSSMDESFLAKLDDAFLAQFAGKTLPVDGIDTVSGATVSSKAVIAAVNSFAFEAPVDEPVEEPVEELPPEGTEYKTTAQGFIDLMAIYTTINDDGVVTAVRVAESDSATDASYVKKVADNKAFLSQFVGKSGEISAADIDVVSGATYSSRAVIEGVNKALSSVQPAEELPAEGTEYESTAQGFMDLMIVYTTINDEGAVTGVRVGESDSATDATYVNKVAADKAFLRQFIGKTEEVNAADIDVVSGATYSSRGVIEGVNRALAAAKPAEELPPEGTEYKTTAQGFIDLMAIYTTINDDGVVTAVRVAESDSVTDASYVNKVAADKAFLNQFVGKTGEINAADIDVVTGATYSSRAVIEGVNKALTSVTVAVPQ
ncbi:MAG: RnfABCDGE type electron transport complex subunit G [Clostridia bacterium]|nr:RnfABCDGE type electron transport complex subunit G [Clostridia bacterium]